MAAGIKFDRFLIDLLSGDHDFVNDTFKLALTNVQPDPTFSFYSDVIEIAPGNGYDAGGKQIVFSAPYVVAGQIMIDAASNVQWVAEGTIPPFSYIVLYNDSAVNKPVVAWYDIGQEINLDVPDKFVFSAQQSILIAQ